MLKKQKVPGGRYYKRIDVVSGVFADRADAQEAHDANRTHPDAIGGRVVRLTRMWMWEVAFEVGSAPAGTKPECVGLLPDDLKLYGIQE